MMVVALMPMTAMAQQVSLQKAEEIALSFNRSQHKADRAASRDAGKMTLSYIAQTGEENDFYVFNYPDNGGFVIVSADSRTLSPVLAYSDHGSFDSREIPSNAAGVLASYQEQIEHLRLSNAAVRPSLNDPIEPTIVVGPLIKTRWGQNAPYNGLCPIDPKTGKRSVTGCIATAISQIMNYWKWPETGHGFHYNYSDTTLFVNYDESVYSWDTTLEEYAQDSDQVLIDNIQKIMFDCGVAANMHYGSNGSSAYDSSVKQAMISYFNYSPTSIRLVYYNDVFYENDNPDSVWISMLKKELDSERPFVMSGQDYYDGSGHAFICDGYDDRNFFHFNFGWGGYLDGYFLPSAINLQDGSSFNSDQTITIGIEPNRTGKWYDGYPMCTLFYGTYAMLEGIIDPYDYPHTVNIPSKATINGKSYPLGIVQAYSFSNNPSITKVNIPEPVYQLGDYAFYGCSRLDSVEIPKSIYFFDYAVFGGCNNLKKLSVHSGNLYYDSPANSNAIIEIQEHRLVQGCNTTIIPNQVEIIGSNSFEGFNGIETIVLPENVTDIESEAFLNCSNLKAVTLSMNTAAIGRNAFTGCDLLKDVYALSDYPPQIQDNTFPSGINVHVLEGTRNAYIMDPYWAAFNIIDDIVDRDGVSLPKTDKEEEHYWDIQGRSIDNTSRGLRISRGKKYYF